MSSSRTKSVLPEILTRVSAALDYGGDFPIQRASLRKLKELSVGGQPSIDAVVRVILCDPILCLRALHRYRAIGTTDDLALNALVRVNGLAPLLELEFNSVLIDDYFAIAQSNQLFLDQLRKSSFSGLLADHLMQQWDLHYRDDLLISSAVLTSGPILLSYYFGRLYRSAVDRARKLNIASDESVSQMLGMPVLGLSISISQTLAIPASIQKCIDMTFAVLTDSLDSTLSDSPAHFQAQALSASYLLAQALSDATSLQDPQRTLEEIAIRTNLDPAQLQFALEQVPASFAKLHQVADIPSPGLPQQFDSFLQLGTPTKTVVTPTVAKSSLSKHIEKMQRIFQCGGSARAILGCALEGVYESLPFDRVLLLLPDTDCKRLYATLCIGHDTPIESSLIATKLDENNRGNAAQLAFLEGRIVFRSPALLPDASLSVSIPIGLDRHTIGVLVADRIARDSQARETLGESVLQELRILTSALHECILNLDSGTQRALR